MLRRLMKPMTRRTMKITTNRKKSNFAIPAAAEAMPPNPNKAATKAITKNTTAQYSMEVPPVSTYTHSTTPGRSGLLSGNLPMADQMDGSKSQKGGQAKTM